MVVRSLLVMVVVVVLVGAALAMDEEMAELARVLRESCAAETGVDVALLDQVNGGADLMPDPKLKCYIKCIMETAGMLGGGDVDVETVVALLPEDMRVRNEHNIRDCGTKKGADDCETAFLTQQCWQRANKKDYFLV